LATSSQAGELTINLPDTAKVERRTISYQCKGLGRLQVEYINAVPNALAVVPIDGKPLVFANVLSGSGARYAAGRYIWWEKGGTAQLSDLRQAESVRPTECREVADK
jgi:membrane-bound inhibitor of C-type lysozyme